MLAAGGTVQLQAALRSTVLNLELGWPWRSSAAAESLVGSPHPAQACGK